MKFIKLLILGAAFGMNFPIVSGASTDADGAPVFYLRGEMEGSNWAPMEKYRFERNENDYTLSVSGLTGEFKISNDDWSLNFGSEGSKYTVSKSCNVNGVFGGSNFVWGTNGDVVIKFTYTDKEKAEISFTVDNSNVTVAGLSGTLPVLYINVFDENGNYDNEVISKDLDHKNYFSGEYWLELNGCDWMAAEGAASIGSSEEPLPLEIKARGNYTRKAFSKKPFKLKLGSKQKMLGLSKSKHFAILAHADDIKGYMRNFTGFSLGERIGLPWTPSQQPVEVVINGDYRGLYFLTESIRVDSDRIDIEELDDEVSDPALISGGYLVELDNYEEENQIRMEEKGQAPGYKDELRITFDTPEVYSELQKRFVREQFEAMNNAIGDNSDELWAYMDMDDAARYYIVEEIISHVEAYHGSTYLFRDRGEGQKWHFSPLWDCGNAFNGPTDGFFYDHAPYGCTWIASMLMNEKFRAKVEETWKWFMSNEFDGIYDDLATYAGRLEAAAKADFERWDGKPVPADGQSVCDNRDMESRLRDVKNHLASKINWLKGVYGDFSEGTFAEPERDTTPAAALPAYAVSGVEGVEATKNAGEIRFFNLQGIELANPEKGGVYIRLQGDKAEKIVF